MGKRQWPYQWQNVEGLGEVLTRGVCGGLPVLAWGWAPREIFATRRQLRAAGLCPGGRGPAVCLHFGHHKPGRRSLEHAALYLVAHAAPKPHRSAAQRASLAKANRARRTCTECGREQPYTCSPLSRMCADCETATDFWTTYAADRGYSWPATA